jgi:DNA anti-recombination protein RmuC
MTGGNRVVGLWPNRAEPRDPDVDDAPDAALIAAEADAEADPEHFYEEADRADAPREFWRMAVSIACLVAGLVWLGFLGWTEGARWMAIAPDPFRIALMIALACPPLALLALVHGLISRGSRAEANRYARVSSQLRSENHRLEATLAHVEARIEASKASVAETGDTLMSLGEDMAQRMHGVAATMRTEVEIIGTQAQALRSSAASARADVAVLLADLPKAHSESRKMTVQLEAAGLSAHEAAGALDAQVSALAARGREADEIAGSAAQKLAAHLSRIESVSATAGERLTEASALMTQSIDAALDHAARASDAARQGLEAQGAAMMALVDQAQAALAKTGAESGEEIALRIGDAHTRVEAMAALLATQSDMTARLLEALRAGLDDVDGRFEKLDTSNEVRGERLTTTLGALSTHAETLTGALEAGADRADTLIGRTEKLMTALDGATREIDEALPAAFERLDARATAAHETIAKVAPDVAAIETSASAALDRLMEAEALLAKQRAALDSFATSAEARIGATQEAAISLSAEIAKADATAHALSEGAAASLVDAMIRVRETAQTAAERAREAIERVIPDAAGQLTEATREALAKTIAEQVGMHIADLTTTAERALEAAHNASDRLMRQMLTIADTSAAIDARIEEAKAHVQENDRDNFARRVALLIESLNSTAIDVTKILSNDVTDSAWAAYLRGDRGVFTRRAVKLLDTSEAREIVRHYEDDPEFREQVNRYIHDFEAMLRNTLATRDGSALSVTLLSSDMGKLYVALAQAIERLRG